MSSQVFRNLISGAPNKRSGIKATVEYFGRSPVSRARTLANLEDRELCNNS